jgi:hypothetical protein
MEFENKKLRSVAEAASRIMMGEQLKGGQVKLDKNHNNKIDAQDFKILKGQQKEETMHEESCDCGDCPSDKDMKKEEVELDEMDKEGYRATRDGDDYTRGKQITVKPKSVMSTKSVTSSAFKQLNKAFNKDSEKKDVKKEDVDLDEGKMGQLDADLKDLSHGDFQKEYGKPKHHYDPSNFKKPVQPGKEMDRAKSLAQRGMASMKKEEVEELEEMFPGTPEYEKKYGKAPQDMKKGEKKKTTQGEMEKTGKGVVHRRKFSEMVESYTEGGVKGLFRVLAEEPTSAEFDAQLADAKKRAAGTKKQPEVSKPAVQAVQNEEVESFEEQTHTTVEFIDYNDVNGVKYAEIDLEERHLTNAETDKKEEIVKSMKKGLSGFKDRYGDRAKEVMYATATKQAKGE